ncbi:trypsin-like peptidase domain-containing protein [Desulfotignum balticum]|uniref:trypsin-like peptidase domain-containing protein n=1 Tax=Desulfotignum balticum TaxID=115781 RepID=UPI0003F751A7|nr:trypsin-like peptidase domain-containing protein [Desulfotignum balticum]
MKKCTNPNCNEELGQDIRVCPYCGQALDTGPDRIDDYHILEFVGETATGSLYRARQEDSGAEVMLRVYAGEMPFTEEQARRIDAELNAVNALSDDAMVRHVAFRQSEQGQWYRVSEWIETASWGDLESSRFFRNPHNRREQVDLLIRMATPLHLLHESGRVMPGFSFDDLLLIRRKDGAWSVKLDYKIGPILSATSLPARSARLERHPDIQTNRHWEKRSDIWTLGRLMLELLVGTDDFDDPCKLLDDIYHRFDPVVLHRKLSGLLRSMVEEDLSRRTSSMAVVLENLQAITDDDIAKWNRFSKDPLKQKKSAMILKRRIGFAASLITLLVISLFFYQRWQTQKETERLVAQKTGQVLELIQDHRLNVDTAVQKSLSQFMVSLEETLPENRMAALADQYRKSIALVLVAGHLEINGKKEISRFGTGTAFLVSSDGYLLTNRHVVLPWDEMTITREDQEYTLEELMEMVRNNGDTVRLVHDVYLWFDGDRAFRTLSTGDALEDIFVLSTAYHNHASAGQKQVQIMGITPEPTQMDRLVMALSRTPDHDDVAVLRVSSVPEGAVPIPLGRSGSRTPIRSGEPVFAMGFPYGHQTIQGNTAISRQTNGTVTRIFEHAIAFDADIHGGNSGGPVIDQQGFAVGIATAINLGLSSMGIALPIQQAHHLLDAIHAGEPQWTGMPFYAFLKDLDLARKAALSGDSQQAAQIMTSLLNRASHPELYLWAGILSADSGRLTPEAKALLRKSLAMNPDNAFIQYLFYRDDFLEGIPSEQRAFREALCALDWRNPYELMGFLVRILEEETDADHAVTMGDTPVDQAFLHWAAADMIKTKEHPGSPDHRRYLHTASRLAPPETHPGFLIHAEMHQPHMAASAGSQPSTAPPTAPGQIDLQSLMSQFQGAAVNKVPQGQSASPPAPEPGILFESAFKHTIKGEWTTALQAVDQYLATPRWENANTLGMGLLKCQLIALQQDNTLARAALQQFIGQTRDPWYRTLAEHLLKNRPAEEIQPKASTLEETLVLATALGLQSEALGNPEQAIRHYNDGLETGLMNWAELQLCLGRREALREGGQAMTD